ncbi:hypothetical protein WBG78_14135 [Chryseolinea sp. T2]|uniref:hypothetical protein n=1 Tax=Chryseolinea sp. T2 TaxID=3129255 RepID=UPI0030781EE5
MIIGLTRRSTFIALQVWIAIVILQTAGHAQDKKRIARGAYNAFRQPDIEDNSFLIEEAFNQPMGVIQHIFNVNVNAFQSRDVSYSFTQEIPLTDKGHQLSYSLSYQSHNVIDSSVHKTVTGFSDIFVSYRPLITDETRWAMIIPRLTVIIPTGKASDGLGSGAFGLQLGLAVTKRFSHQLITHYNLGCTTFFGYDSYAMVNGDKTLVYERTTADPNAGVGIVWNAWQKFNFLLESVSSRSSLIQGDGLVDHSWHHLVNPGVRFAVNARQLQLVPGVSYPIDIVGRGWQGALFYLSIEPDYQGAFRK